MAITFVSLPPPTISVARSFTCSTAISVNYYYCWLVAMQFIETSKINSNILTFWCHSVLFFFSCFEKKNRISNWRLRRNVHFQFFNSIKWILSLCLCLVSLVSNPTHLNDAINMKKIKYKRIWRKIEIRIFTHNSFCVRLPIKITIWSRWAAAAAKQQSQQQQEQQHWWQLLLLHKRLYPRVVTDWMDRICHFNVDFQIFIFAPNEIYRFLIFCKRTA